ncbi:Major facilitator, sugar transporter-like [Dillenia turbinata]|uniref:Major facilitator, sugar transporter-like n=1 Tax=Dillenia turbinata TaxID=194707 RepID=A0AAN8ZHN6_9MAGN
MARLTVLQGGYTSDTWLNGVKKALERILSKAFILTVLRGGYTSDTWLNGVKKALEHSLEDRMGQEATNPSWKLSLPHVLVASIVPILFGYHLGVVNEPLESIALDLGFTGNTMAEGLVVSTCLAGAFGGCLLSGWVADEVGRRRAFQLCALPMIIGAAISAMTQRLFGMLLGRFLVGTGLGLGPPVASLYVAEVSPASVRGTYGSFIQIATCLGLLSSLLIGIPVKEIVGWWRVCFWVSIIPAAILAVAMMFCAESPHWLYKKGRSAEAEVEFEKLLGGLHVRTAMAELSKADRGEDTDTVKFSDLFYGHHFKVVFIGSALFFFQQLSGINAVFYFSSAVFRSLGISPNLANGFVGIANLTGSLIATSLMDKVGRKLLLLLSFFGMAISVIIQVAAASPYVTNYGAMYLSVGGMLLFVLTFAVGAGPVPGLLLPEIFPNRIREKAMAVCMTVHWVVNFFVGLLFLRFLDILGRQILYSIFATDCLIAVAFVKKNVVETKGRSLQEIEIALLPAE